MVYLGYILDELSHLKYRNTIENPLIKNNQRKKTASGSLSGPTKLFKQTICQWMFLFFIEENKQDSFT